jgi:hypothetical protein
MTATDLTQRALDRIAICRDPNELRRIIVNAKTAGNLAVHQSAQRKLYSVRPDAPAGSFEHDVWQSIYALEGSLAETRGKTTLLSRTRQKIKRDGERKTVADLVTKPAASDGYRMLIERGWPELTFEAVALRHPDSFDATVLTAAKNRLHNSDCEVAPP